MTDFASPPPPLDPALTASAALLRAYGRASVSLLQRRLRISYLASVGIMRSLAGMNVVTALNDDNSCALILPAGEKRFAEQCFETAVLGHEMYMQRKDGCDGVGHLDYWRLLNPFPGVDADKVRGFVAQLYEERSEGLQLFEVAHTLATWNGGVTGERDAIFRRYLLDLCRKHDGSSWPLTLGEREFHRLARYIDLEREHGSFRAFSSVVSDQHVFLARGLAGGTTVVNVVPHAVLKRIGIEMFEAGQNRAQVAQAFRSLLIDAVVTEEEARRLVTPVERGGVGLHDAMPADWVASSGNQFARLAAAGIGFELVPGNTRASIKKPK